MGGLSGLQAGCDSIFSFAVGADFEDDLCGRLRIGRPARDIEEFDGGEDRFGG